MLSERNLIQKQQRKRPVVKALAPDKNGSDALSLPAVTAVPEDIFDTGRLLCFPAIEKGVALCTEEDWAIPAAIVERMDVFRSTEFWRLSHCFWRFFIARNGNDLLLRAVDSLGFSTLEPLPGSLELREAYLKTLRYYVRAVSVGERLGKGFFEDLAQLYGVNSLDGNDAQREKCYSVVRDSPLHTGLMDLEQRLRSAEERYSRVYMDIIGLIAIGRYQPRDRLPSHKEMQRLYGVSSDTTAKAVHVLQDWGVVTAKRGDGIYVAMDLEGLKHVRLSPDLVGCHLRRFLDSLELLSLTADGVAEHASMFITADEAHIFRQKMERLWNEEYLYQLTPIILLDFITGHIRYSPLKEIYQVFCQNYQIGRSIPKLVTHEKSFYNHAMFAMAILFRGQRFTHFPQEAQASDAEKPLSCTSRA